MSGSSSAFAFNPSDDTASQPSNLDARFAVNQSMQFSQVGEARAFGFSYIDDSSGRQVTEWVFQPAYVPPPALEATAEAPSDPAHVFTSLDQWKAALEATGPDAIWQPGSTFNRSWVATFRGVPSKDPAFYAPYEQWPTVPVAPAAGDVVDQVDPGSAHAPAGPVEDVNSMTAKAALRVVTAAGAGHPERGDTNAYTVEFWAMFNNYVEPTSQDLPVVPGPPVGVPPQSLSEYLEFWNSADAPATVDTLAVVTCSRSRVNPYGA